MLYLIIICFLSHLLYTGWKLTNELHIIQLNSYRNDRFLLWLKNNVFTNTNFKELLPILAIIFLFAEKTIFASIIWITCYILLFILRSKKKKKKKLVFTTRAKRLFCVNISCLILLYIVFLNISLFVNSYNLIIVFFLLFLFNIFSFVLMLLSNIITHPIELIINKWYYNDAKNHIKKIKDLKVIGITGSYGKTSTKHILYEILNKNFNTLMTPKSYNTTMGVIKTIRTLLKPIHEIFIVEMGAKQIGDIKDICDLVSPEIGILTSIGPQHLESFKNIENVKKTKFELIYSLPENGIAFVNMDDPNCKDILNTSNIKTICYGLNSKSEELDYWIDDITFNDLECNFTIKRKDQTSALFQTRLLGRHNLYNILVSVAVGCELGIDFNILTHVIRNLKPVKHRLDIKKTPQNITIIDDTFNSNPNGSRQALEVLKQFAGNKKILITPGMVELGEKQYELNKIFGSLAANICDYIILVGKNQTIAIQDGLNEKKFPNENLYIAKNFSEANIKLNKIVNSGDVVLFENDLPDNYKEA